MIDTDTLKREHPIAEVVARYGIPLRRQGRALVALCPFHRETKPSFNVDPGAGLWYCFGCARGGDVISFVMEMANVGFVEACEILSNGRLPELPPDACCRQPLPADWVQMAEPHPPRKLNRAEPALPAPSIAEGSTAKGLATALRICSLPRCATCAATRNTRRAPGCCVAAMARRGSSSPVASPSSSGTAPVG